MSWESRRARLKKSLPGRALLWVLSGFYGAAVILRRKLYEWGLFKSQRLGAKVVCIGNLTTGGTGKTPAVLLAAKTLRQHELPLAILSRGYGRTGGNGAVTTLLDDAPPPWTECGDEPWMLHHALHGQKVPILVCADRVKAGQEAVTFYHSRLVILDDGFQHLRLHRDLDVVLVNASDPFGGGRLLPLGNLREPVSTLSRAGLVVITHADRVSDEALEAIRREVKRHNPRAPVLEAAHRPDFLLDVRSQERRPLKDLHDRKVVALSGIADHAGFEELLGRLGAVVAQRWRYPDHHPYRPRELRAVENVRHGLPVVTTMKDYTRLPKRWEDLLRGDVYVLAVKLEITKGKEQWAEALAELAGPGGGA